jgi:hypothetical protein
MDISKRLQQVTVRTNQNGLVATLGKADRHFGGAYCIAECIHRLNVACFLKCWHPESEAACGNGSASGNKQQSAHSRSRKFPSKDP